MRAKFKVDRSYLLPSRSLFVMEGAILEGVVHPGMNAHLSFNSKFSMACPIKGVEFVRRENDERVALTVNYEQQEEGDFLQYLNICNEELILTDE